MTSIKITCGFCEVIVEDFFRLSTWTKGNQLSKSGHVRLAMETIEQEVNVITAKCLPQTNVNCKEYVISIKVSVICYCLFYLAFLILDF